MTFCRARSGLLLCCFLGLSGCASLWPTQWPFHTRPALDLPVTAPVALKPLSLSIDEWWKAFNDPVLDQLVADALANNLDLAKAAANIAEARANAVAAKALTQPRVDALGKAGGTQRQISAGSDAEDFNKFTSSAAVGLGISWEIDLWGRIAQMNEASLARLAASEQTRDATVLSVSAAVTDTYFQLLALDAKLRLTRDAEAGLRSVADLELRRWKAEVGTEFAYRQSLAELASTEARIPSIESAITKTELALALLTGRSPRQMAEPLARQNVLPKLPDTPREFDTALLLRRPDVASAEQMLVAANADVNAARAEQKPRLNLSLLAGLIATSSSAVSGFPLYADLSAGLTAPIYDAGLLQSKVDGAEARKEKAIAHYRYTLNLAFRDTYEALMLRERGDAQYQASANEVAIRKQSLVLAEKSYDAGRSSKFEVLSEMIKVLNAQLALADARQNQFLARSQTYKALGGGF
jgi:outer membrane protein, multidrug efflux system